MTEKSTMKQTLLGGLTVGLLLLLFVLSGCGNPKNQQENKNQQSQSAETETKKINFSKEKYQEKIVDGRIAITEYPNHYEQEIQEIQNLFYPNIHFTEDCTFAPFPEELSRLSVFFTTEHGMSVQEGLATLGNWLVSIGKQEDVNLEKEVRVISPDVEIDESKDAPECYPLLTDVSIEQLGSGDALLLDTKQCYAMIGAGGIFMMSNGKISAYLGETNKPGNDIYMKDDFTLLQSGNVEKLKEEAYPLISGVCQIGECAEHVKKYFEEGTPFPMAEGVKIDVPDINVYQLDDNTCMYNFFIRKWYENMPYMYQHQDAFANTYEGYGIIESLKFVNVVDDTGVATFMGPSESDMIHTLYQDTQMVGMKQALDLASQKLTSFLKLNVQEVKIGYASYVIDTGLGLDDGTSIYYPFWEFCGINTVKNQALNVYVDMISGAVYYVFDDM